MEPPADTGTTQIVTVRSKSQYQIRRLQVEVEGGSAPHCDLVRRFVVDIALLPPQSHFPLAEERPPNFRLAGHHRPHEGSKERYMSERQSR